MPLPRQRYPRAWARSRDAQGHPSEGTCTRRRAALRSSSWQPRLPPSPPVLLWSTSFESPPFVAAAAAFFISFATRRRKQLIELVDASLREPAIRVAGFSEILGVRAVDVSLEIFRPVEHLVHEETSGVVARLVNLEAKAVLLNADASLGMLEHALL